MTATTRWPAPSQACSGTRRLVPWDPSARKTPAPSTSTPTSPAWKRLRPLKDLPRALCRALGQGRIGVKAAIVYSAVPLWWGRMKTPTRSPVALLNESSSRQNWCRPRRSSLFDLKKQVNLYYWICADNRGNHHQFGEPGPPAARRSTNRRNRKATANQNRKFRYFVHPIHFTYEIIR